MNYVRILSVAAIGAIALMAFAASSASATTLKSGGVTITEIEASLTGSAKLTETGGTVLDTCTVGGISGKTNADTAIELKGVDVVSWGAKGAGCTQTTDTLNNGTFGITWIAGTNSGTVKSYGAEVTVEVGGIFSCVYGTSATGTTLGTLVGSEVGNATLSINVSVQFKSGPPFCPQSTVWMAEYKVTKPATLTVVE